jgi:hypothetical protein
LNKSVSLDTKIRCFQTDDNNLISISKNLKNINKKVISTVKLDKVFYNQLLSEQKKKYLIVELPFHPKTFFELTHTLLASNDNQLINSFKANTSIFDLIK